MGQGVGEVAMGGMEASVCFGTAFEPHVEGEVLYICTILPGATDETNSDGLLVTLLTSLPQG